MALNKNPKVNLRAKYQRFLEISFIVTLSLIIAAFKFFPDVESKALIKEIPPDIIDVVDVEHTRQQQRPPMPPRPEIIISGNPDEIITEIDLPPTDLDLFADNTTPPPIDRGKKKVIEDEPFIPWAEIMPEPVGGIQAIQSRIKYPELARKAGIEGKVYVMASVDEKGDVVHVDLVRGAGGGLDEEALKAVMNTKFKPGQQRGIPVKVKIVIPVIFKLK
jgi:periplasmic protein TonB